MKKMKRLLTVILAAAIILQTGAFTVSGESPENDKQVITISNIDTSQLAGEPAGSSAGSTTEIETEGIAANSIKIVSEEWTGPAEFVISGSNIAIKGGKYSYRLVIRSDRTLTFDNDLEIYYEGVNGRYKLHYDIDKTDNHTMVVTGVFDNIIISSPLLQKISAAEREWILAHISKDSYFYQMILKTKEGFSFINSLRYLFDAKKHGYVARYSYDLKTDKQTLIICGIPECDSAAADAVGAPADTAAAAAEETVQETSAPAAKPAPAATGGTSAATPPAKAVTPPAKKTAAPAKKAAAPKAKKIIFTFRYSKLRKKAQTIKAAKIFGSAVKVRGRKKYARVSGNKKITINKKTGNVTVKKGLKKGSYKVTVKQMPAGKTKNKASLTKRVTFTVRVK